MSAVQIQGNASGTGTLTIAAPNTNTNRTLTLPDNTGTLISTGSTFAGTGPAFRVYLSANQTVTSTVNTKVTLNTEVFDTANAFNNTGSTVGTAPAYSFNPQVAGYYQFNVTLGGYSATALNYNWIQIYKNGTSDSIALYGPYNGTSNYGVLSSLIYLNGSTDYIELYAQISGTGTLSVLGSATSASTYMSGYLARSA